MSTFKNNLSYMALGATTTLAIIVSVFPEIILKKNRNESPTSTFQNRDEDDSVGVQINNGNTVDIYDTSIDNLLIDDSYSTDSDISYADRFHQSMRSLASRYVSSSRRSLSLPKSEIIYDISDRDDPINQIQKSTNRTATATSVNTSLDDTTDVMTANSAMTTSNHNNNVSCVDSPSSSSPCIYLDYNGTTPIHPRVLLSMMPYFTMEFGNPSSSHYYGHSPKKAIQEARMSILNLLFSPTSITEEQKMKTYNFGENEKSDDNESNNLNLISDNNNNNNTYDEKSIIFTGCGTESNNLAIQLAIQSSPSPKNGRKKHVITSNIEHPAITECLKLLQSNGEIDVTFIPVDDEGIISVQDVVEAIRPDNETILVTIMYANNECGSLQPIRKISKICREQGILFHTDAAQAVGKVSVSLSHDSSPEDEDGIESEYGPGPAVDMLTIVGHKFGAPKGIAALYVRSGCLNECGRTEPQTYGKSGVMLLGGGQECGRRSGTENVPYIVGLGTAADLLMKKIKGSDMRKWQRNSSHMETLRSRLLEKLKIGLGEENVKPNGPSDLMRRLPNTLSVGLRNVQSAELLASIQMTVACSAGSACHASGGKISPVLAAMNVPEEFARGTLRLSVGPSTTISEVDEAAVIIIAKAKKQYLKRNTDNMIKDMDIAGGAGCVPS